MLETRGRKLETREHRLENLKPGANLPVLAENRRICPETAKRLINGCDINPPEYYLIAISFGASFRGGVSLNNTQYIPRCPTASANFSKSTGLQI